MKFLKFLMLCLCIAQTMPFEIDAQSSVSENLPIAAGATTISNAVSIYPNPITEQSAVELQTNGTDEVTLEIFDLHGKLVQTLCRQVLFDEGQQRLPLNLPSGAGGIYTYRCRIGNELHTGKFIKP